MDYNIFILEILLWPVGFLFVIAYIYVFFQFISMKRLILKEIEDIKIKKYVRDIINKKLNKEII